MAKCKWRDKPGSAENCGLLAEAGGELCPRHKYLQQLRDRDEEEKHRKRVLARKVVTSMPHTRRELIERGYQLTGSGNCRACDQHIEWWRTPNGNSAPYDPMTDADSVARSHFATCTHANQFRRAS